MTSRRSACRSVLPISADNSSARSISSRSRSAMDQQPVKAETTGGSHEPKAAGDERRAIGIALAGRAVANESHELTGPHAFWDEVVEPGSPPEGRPEWVSADDRGFGEGDD